MSKRAYVVFAVAALAIVGLLVRYSCIMVFSPKEDSRQKNYRVERGPILDRNGNVLAIQTRLFRVSAWKPSLKGKNPDNIIKKLAEILDLNEDEIREMHYRGMQVISLNEHGKNDGQHDAPSDCKKYKADDENDGSEARCKKL